MENRELTIEPIRQVFSVCKVEDYAGVNPDQPFCFTGRTDEEKSLLKEENFEKALSVLQNAGYGIQSGAAQA